MQPYQEAGQEIQRQNLRPLKALQTAGSLVLTGGASLAAGKILNKALPYLNEFIPQDLAIKGLNKIDPRFGNFINTAMNNGKSFDEVKEFIKEKGNESQKPPSIERNVLQKYSDKLHEFVDSNIKKGLNPAQVVSLAEIFPHHKKDIDKIVKDYKTPFLNIVESIYGSPQQAKASQGQPMQGQQQTQQGQSGQGQQALQAILQQINQRLGG